MTPHTSMDSTTVSDGMMIKDDTMNATNTTIAMSHNNNTILGLPEESKDNRQQLV